MPMRSTDWDKVAERYFEEVDSPFMKGVKNPIPRMLGQVKNASEKSVLEIGCGLGTLTPSLARRFKRVIGIDISRRMIELAEKKHGNLKNVEFKVMDALNICRLQRKFDVVVTVNGIIMPNIQKVNKVLRRARRVLKRGGVFLGIFPSADAVVYQAMVSYDLEYDRLGKRKIARLRASRLISKKKHDFCYGLFNYDGKQKWFYGQELEYRLKKAGFKDIRICKVRYPWSHPRSDELLGKNLYEAPWDWVVSAKN